MSVVPSFDDLARRAYARAMIRKAQARPEVPLKELSAAEADALTRAMDFLLVLMSFYDELAVTGTAPSAHGDEPRQTT